MKILMIVAAVFTIAGCSSPPPGSVMDGDDEQSMLQIATCTVANSDGVRCDMKTCKSDRVLDCARFEIGCTTYYYTYTGDRNSGTCRRGPLVGGFEGGRDRLVFASRAA